MTSTEIETNQSENTDTENPLPISEQQASDNNNEDVKSLISEGLRENTIESLIANRVHSITDKYDEQLKNLLKQRDSLRAVLNSYSLFINTKLMSLPSQDLSQVMLLDLWKQNNLLNVLSCIRAVSFAKTEFVPDSEEDQEFDNDKFFESTVKCFYHSRALMGIVISPQIIELIQPGFKNKTVTFEINREAAPNNNFSNNSNSTSNSRSTSLMQSFKPAASYKFLYKTNEKDPSYTVLLENKNEGAQFGGCFTVNDSDGDSQKYFVKAYYGYPAKGDFNSEKAFTSSMSFNCNSELFMDIPFEMPQYSSVDFKELFIYKVLEQLNVGPKSFFIINPYLKDGLFIVTEDLNTQSESFIEMGKMDPVLEVVINNILIEMRNGDLEQSEYGVFNSLAGLLEIDTINRVFGLLDANDGNFGYLTSNSIKKKKHVTKNNARTWLMNEHEFRIIDFFQPKTNDTYIVDDIFNSFLRGDSKYVNGHFMDFAIRREIDEVDDDDEEEKELIKKHREEKIFFGKQVIQRLDHRFDAKGGLNALLNEAKKEIIEFLNKKCNALPKLNIAAAIGLTDEYIQNGMKDLDNYICGIMKNYDTLKNSIFNNDIC